MSRAAAFRAWIDRYGNVAFFVGGFIFDSLTLVRIDSTLDLALQAAYLAGITLLVVLQARVEHGRWTPPSRLKSLWHYESEVLHFFYGGLLSAYVIFYFKSATASKSLIFFGLVVVLMFANEMPQVRRAGASMRLGLYAFCVLSFLNYLIPVLAGRMGVWTFALAILLTALIAFCLVRHLANYDPAPKIARLRLGWAPALVLGLLTTFYALHWIPPVPLSLQYSGVFHAVNVENGHYQLIYRKPPWYRFWRRQDQPFLARPGDRIVNFVRIFAPRRFRHQVYLRWLMRDPRTQTWKTQDRIPLPIYGGRDAGFRGYATKGNFVPGQWRVEAETEDERTLGWVAFEVIADRETDLPEWRELQM
jgi:hypothetical protein